MKKIYLKYTLLTVALISSLLFTACGHKHTFADATCTTPKTCNECGEIEGEALGHTWVDATCENPKTCTVCNLTEGDILEHVWTEDNKICDLCGIENPDYDNPEEYAAEDYYDTEETIAESEPEVEVSVEVANTMIDRYRERYEKGEISKRQYEAAMEAFGQADELADENGNFNLNEAANNTSSGTNSGSGTTSYEYNPNSYSAQHGIQGVEGADGSLNIQWGQGDYTGLEKYRTN